MYRIISTTLTISTLESIGIYVLQKYIKITDEDRVPEIVFLGTWNQLKKGFKAN